MIDRPLRVGSLAERAASVFGDREVVTRTADGTDRTTYAELAARAHALADALRDLGVGPGGCVASFAWNSQRHLELALAVPSLGAVLHTLNVRHHPDELRRAVDRSGPSVLFVDASLVDELPVLAGPVHRVLMADDRSVARPDGFLDHDELVARGDRTAPFVDRDEQEPAVLCFTSGTTGRPVGVRYTHRSIVLGAMATNSADACGLRACDTVLPVVPMFHACSWGLPFAAMLAGARLVLPGPRPTADAICELLRKERVTLAAGVPTVWHDLLERDELPELPDLREVVCAGSAVSSGLADRLRTRLGARLVHGWGMTETGTFATIAHRSDAATAGVELRAGHPLPLVELRLAEDGEIELRGPTVAHDYFGDSHRERITDDGWLRTGDVGRVGSDGAIELVDRKRDLVRSGGEWIPTMALERALSAHPGIAEAAVVGVEDERWGERPVAYVTVYAGGGPTASELRAWLTARVAGWWIPERIGFVAALPRTSVGKVDKQALRRAAGGADRPVGSADAG